MSALLGGWLSLCQPSLKPTLSSDLGLELSNAKHYARMHYRHTGKQTLCWRASKACGSPTSQGSFCHTALHAVRGVEIVPYHQCYCFVALSCCHFWPWPEASICTSQQAISYRAQHGTRSSTTCEAQGTIHAMKHSTCLDWHTVKGTSGLSIAYDQGRCQVSFVQHTYQLQDQMCAMHCSMCL